MKVKEVKISGSLGYKVQVAQFEPMDVTAYVEYTADVEDENDPGIGELEQKVNETLKNQVNRRFEVGVRNYKDKIVELKRVIK